MFFSLCQESNRNAMPFLIIVTQTIMCVMKCRPRTLGKDTLLSIERVRQEIVALLGRKKIR